MKNYVNLIGRIGTDPDTKDVQEGRKVTNFTLATESVYKDSNQEKQAKTTWHQISLWGNDNLIPHLKKGTLISLDGSIENSSYEKEIGGEKVQWPTSKVSTSNVILLPGSTKSE